jgi:multiple sugar transport system substrate-binding protein
MQSGKMTRRDLLKLGTTATLAFTALGVAACGAPAAAPTTAPAAAQPTKAGEAAKAAEAKPAASGGTIELNQFYHQYGEKGTDQAVLDYAKEYTAANPNVKINVLWTPGDWQSKLSASLASGSGPDVFEHSAPSVAMVKANQLAPLDDLIKDVKDDFDPHDLQTGTIGGKLYWIKMIDDTGALYYRKSILEKAGVKPPTTFDELMAAAKALTTAKQKGFYVGNDGGIAAMVINGPVSAGAKIIDDTGIKFNTEETAAFFDGMAKFNKDGSLLMGAPADCWDPGALTQNLTAMQWGGMWAYPEIKKQLKDDFGVVPWPAFGAKGKPVTFWGGWGECVNPQSKNVDAAKAFVKWQWVDNAKIQTDWSLAYGFHIPPRKSVAEKAEVLKTGQPNEIMKSMYANGFNTPPTWTAAMDTALQDAMSNVIKNGKNSKDVLDAAAKKCEEELANQK